MKTINLQRLTTIVEHSLSAYCMSLIEQELLIEAIKKDEVNKAEMFTVITADESELERAERILYLSKKHRTDKAELEILQSAMLAVSADITQYLSTLSDHRTWYTLKRPGHKNYKFYFQLIGDRLHTYLAS